MAGRFDFILDFLTADHFYKVKAEALKEIPPTLGKVTSFDEKNGIITGIIGGEDGEIHDFKWSFEGHMVNLVIDEIIPKLKGEIRELRYGATNQTKVYTDAGIDQILNRLVIDLEERLTFLSKSGFSIGGVEKYIGKIIKDLKTYKARLKKDVIWKGKRSKESKFKGYKLTHSRIDNAAEITSSIWELLHRKKLVEIKDKNAFLSLFDEKWRDNTINWLGTPKEFYAFYDALFNPAIEEAQALIDLAGYNGRLQRILKCFDVIDPIDKVKIDSKGIRKYSSKPKENALSKALRDLIENQLL